MQAMTLRLPDDIMRELRLASTYTGDPASLIILRLVREYLDGPVRDQICAGLAADQQAMISP